jgi:hypothetical protein
MARYLMLLSILVLGAEAGAAEMDSAGGPPVPQEIAKFFAPPAAYAGRLGDYRSPLLFEDGRTVKTAADWAKRRREILDRWHSILGPWPPIIEKPTLDRLSEERREDFTQVRVRVEVAPGQRTEGWLLLPDGAGPFPAVVVPFYEPQTSIGLGKSEYRDYAYQLTRRGFVTLSIGSPGGDARRPEVGQAVCQPLSYLAYVAANCANALAGLPQVDGQRIGIIGHSYGGKWALFGSCLYDRFAAAVWSDPGIVFDETRGNVNYWEPWYLGLDPALKRKPGIPRPDNPRTGAYRQLVELGMDLHELHVLMAPRPFLVSGGSEDPPGRWIPLNHSIAVNRLLGHENRVAMTNRPGHSPTEESNEQVYLFFEHFLKRR